MKSEYLIYKEEKYSKETKVLLLTLNHQLEDSSFSTILEALLSR
jgi:hypothetical protein